MSEWHAVYSRGAPATLVKVYASWSVFLDYCTRVKGLFTVNPMAVVEKPDVRRGPIQFYDLDTVSGSWTRSPTRRGAHSWRYSTERELRFP